VTQPANTERFRRFAKTTEWPLAGLALLLIPSILLDHRARTLGIHGVSLWLNWIVWVAFSGELAVKAWLAPDRRYFFRHAWFDLLIVVLSPPFIGPEYLQGLRAIRAIRLLRLLQFIRAFAVAGIALESARSVLEHRRFHYVAMAIVVLVGLGALSMYVVEHGINPAIQTAADALWWAAETAAVGSGDITPRTSGGRLIALALLLCGIAFIGIFTATIASYFFRKDHERELARLESQLHRLEQKQDQILETVNHLQGEPL
jgi:voltage-gated potassium channel